MPSNSTGEEIQRAQQSYLVEEAEIGGWRGHSGQNLQGRVPKRRELLGKLQRAASGYLSLWLQTLHMCGLEKEPPENSRPNNSWSILRARNSSRCYQPKWRNLKVHWAWTLDRALSSLKTKRTGWVYLQVI